MFLAWSVQKGVETQTLLVVTSFITMMTTPACRPCL